MLFANIASSSLKNIFFVSTRIQTFFLFRSLLEAYITLRLAIILFLIITLLSLLKLRFFLRLINISTTFNTKDMPLFNSQATKYSIVVIYLTVISLGTRNILRYYSKNTLKRQLSSRFSSRFLKRFKVLSYIPIKYSLAYLTTFLTSILSIVATQRIEKLRLIKHPLRSFFIPTNSLNSL